MDTVKPVNVEYVCRVVSVRAQKRMTFFVLKDCKTRETFQAIFFKQNLPVPVESVVKVVGNCVVPGVPIKSDETTIKEWELHLSDLTVLSKSEILPIQIADLNHNNKIGDIGENGDGNQHSVGFAVCLDNRVLDLRSKRNQSIFRLKSALIQNISQYFWENDFIQIHTPKLTGAASEGGAEVFHTSYFGNPAYLVQSPQLYKQMCVNSDLLKVFEIGPVFRAENSRDSRHLCEFIGVDIEMALATTLEGSQPTPEGSQPTPEGSQPSSDYTVIFNVFWNMLRSVFGKLFTKTVTRELINQIQPESCSFQMPVEPIVMKHREVIELLRANGYPDLSQYDDLKNEHEIKLGELVLAKYYSDVVIVDQYPTALRPFYTKTNASDPMYSNSYDIIFRGQEVLSGAQRINDYAELVASAQKAGVNTNVIGFYLDSFKHGSFDQAGGGFGLERLLARFLRLPNIQSASLFPRTPNRLTP